MKKRNITFTTILLALACFALSPLARAAVVGSAFNGNTADGFDALHFLTTGILDTATGAGALSHTTTGISNTANGAQALTGNITGNHNTATGRLALYSNTTGSYNTANGRRALSNTTGNTNIGLGFAAGENLTTGDNNIDIGNLGVAGEANTIRIGEPTAVTEIDGVALQAHTATFIAGISGAAVAGATVHVNGNGQLGVAPSSARFKDGIKPMDKASEAILALKPVTFHYKKEIDPDRTPQFGLVAEQVEKVNPDLIVRDAKDKPYTVRYEAVNAMLLNEFLKEHRKVQEQGATIAKQQKQIEALATGLQKVSDELELSKPALRTVGNNQ
jgi:hypothetical protein